MSENQNLPAVVQQQHHIGQHAEPFGRMMAAQGVGINAGAVAIEQERAIAEAQGKMVLAKRFPRSNANARAEFMEACADPEFAAAAFYSVKNRGTGPSIRFAEEVARCYQNFDYGHRELSRSEGKSEVEVYAWDMERNNFSRRQITVEHVLDTQDGPRKLKNQSDIDNRIANIASKQVRGRILALMPKALVQAGIARCKLTLAGNGETTIGQRVTKMVEVFAKFGVTPKHIEGYLGHTTDSVTVDELADLTGIFNAIKEGAKASDYFGQAEKADATAATAAAITNQAKQAAAQNSAAPAADAPSPAPAPATRSPRRNPAQSDSNVTKETAPDSGQKAAADVVTEANQTPAPTPAPAPAQAPAASKAAEDDVF